MITVITWHDCDYDHIAVNFCDYSMIKITEKCVIDCITSVIDPQAWLPGIDLIFRDWKW